MPAESLSGGPGGAVFWSAATIAAYMIGRVVYRLHRRPWASPLLVAPALLLALALCLHEGYGDYIRGTHWLLTMLGPVTVAFALPIYEQRALIRRHWPILVVGVLVGSSVAILTAWLMASLLGFSPGWRLSLLPRSITTPFAMAMSNDIGGVPELTAIFVILTGLCGAAVGEILLKWLPLRSSLARGALLGMGAQGAGVARAQEMGGEEASVAGLVMILAGLLNVLAAPFLAWMVV
jgi:predicted murein hydrolase (TIGR00659 family)